MTDPDTVPRITLNNGAKMPIVGYGTWYETTTPDLEEVQRWVEQAIDAGYRMVDTAKLYGTEEAVGKAIQAKLEEGVLKSREDIFVVSKLWLTDVMPMDVRPALEQTLKKLNLDYIDLYLIHAPWALKPGKVLQPKGADGDLILNEVNDHLATWRMLETCVDDGLTKGIGVSSFSIPQILKIMDRCRIRPANNQIEVQPYFARKKLVKLCQDRDVSVTSFLSVGRPNSKNWVKCNRTPPTKLPFVCRLADKYEVSPAQVLLKFQVQRGIAVIPRSKDPEHIKENIQLFDFELEDGEIESLLALDVNIPLVQYEKVRDHKDFPSDYPPVEGSLL